MSEVKEKTSTDRTGYTACTVYSWTLILSSAVAFIASFGLVLERIKLYKNADYVASCDIGGPFSCSSVMETPQAAIFGFPNQLIGLFGFAITGTIGVILLTKAKLPRWFMIAHFIGISLAMVFVIWFWSQALYSIRQLCIYCMVVWAAVIPMFWASLRLAVVSNIISVSNRFKELVKEWTWLAIVSTYVATVLTVLLAFTHVWADMLSKA